MAKNKNIKKPRLRDTSHIQIKEEPPDHGKLNPIFSFYHMRYGTTYCLSKCCPADKSDLATLLLRLSQRTWNDISSTYRKSFGFEHIPIKQFNATVFPDIVTPDVKTLLVFSYSHGGRMAGIQQKDVFHILLTGDDLYPHK